MFEKNIKKTIKILKKYQLLLADFQLTHLLLSTNPAISIADNASNLVDLKVLINSIISIFKDANEEIKNLEGTYVKSEFHDLAMQLSIVYSETMIYSTMENIEKILSPYKNKIICVDNFLNHLQIAKKNFDNEFFEEILDHLVNEVFQEAIIDGSYEQPEDSDLTFPTGDFEEVFTHTRILLKAISALNDYKIII